MENLDISNWVLSARRNETELREAVHTLFVAISNSDYLRDRMFVKGGILLAVRYQSTRYTKDADFSTADQYAEFDRAKFLEELERQLTGAVEGLNYNLDCRIQKHEVSPAGDDKSFQTLTVTIGHAYKGTKKHESLRRGACSSVLKIDYSFNEYSRSIDVVYIDGGSKKLLAYSLPDLIAEKYRSIIQQKVRNRARRQDTYDISFLMSKAELEKEGLKEHVLDSLLLKSEARGLRVDRHSLRDEDVKRRSSIDYDILANEIEGDIQPFEEVYCRIRDYYESLPWED